MLGVKIPLKPVHSKLHRFIKIRSQLVYQTYAGVATQSGTRGCKIDLKVHYNIATRRKHTIVLRVGVNLASFPGSPNEARVNPHSTE